MFGLRLLSKFLEGEKPKVDSGRCVRKFLKAKCESCRRDCPKGAIELANLPRVDEALCNGCGVCVNACPAGVFVLPAVTRLKSSGGARLACSRAGNGPQRGLDIPCLGALSEGDLLAALAKRDILALDASPCGKCDSQRALAVIERTAERTNSILKALANSKIIEIEYRVRESQVAEPYSRREFLSHLRGRAVKVAAESLEGVLEEVPLLSTTPKVANDVVSAKHVLLQRQIESMVATSSALSRAELPYGRPGRPVECRYCGLCALVCPSAALRVNDTDESWDLVLESWRCVDCKACSQVCPVGSLPYSESVEATAFLEDHQEVLVHCDKRICVSCGCRFPSPDATDICPSCRKAKEVAFS